MLMSVTDWMDEVSGSEYIWYVKRLSGNDTLANGSNQAGPYIPRDFILNIFPSVAGRTDENQEKWFDLFIDSHGDHRNVRMIWYNNKSRGGTRNEARVTNFGGASSALLDPESTGALSIFAFRLDGNGEALDCHVWVSRHGTEEDLIEDRIGPVEPGAWRIGKPENTILEIVSEKTRRSPCWLEPSEIPVTWLSSFPTGMEIIKKAVELSPYNSLDPDNRIVKRRICEFNLFRSVEEAIELPRITDGFSTLDDFLIKAQSILQRRKSRSGRSLELHMKEIFLEEGLEENSDFSHQPVSEIGKKPDFLFPSADHYHNTSFPDNKLRMLAVKTTCKDRWRQILNEAERIGTKHLLTLQEGISVNQFREMQDENVQLVVPSPIIESYADEIRPHLQTLESFIGDVRLLKF